MYAVVVIVIICSVPYKDADPIISEDVEKKFLGIVHYNVTEGGIACGKRMFVHIIVNKYRH